MADASKPAHVSSFEGSSLQSVEWLRVVLDEAHKIRNRSTKQYKAVLSLQARHRWCLSGTPIFNGVEDFGSLLGFLGAQPFNAPSTFKSWVVSPVKSRRGKGLEALRKLVQATCLRRMKEDVAGELRLATCHKPICEVELSGEERALYNVLKTSFAALIGDAASPRGRGAAASGSTGIFQTILRLRQFCNHGGDLLPPNLRELLQYSAVDREREGALVLADNSCACCGHAHGPSEVTEGVPLPDIIFSCWTGMLDLVEEALYQENLEFARIDGGVSEPARREAIARFRSDEGCNILLASIGSAGVGLDLTVASRVHLLEPQWTPTAEAQALDRVHRIGQTQEVIARRYIVKDSIEEYIVNVQQVKTALINQSFATEEQEHPESARERLAK
ncbi:hypothetical protein QIS74_02492 [Colletotrichum tabaci]|uniref:Helicase C-terminal domain-containing protein n=1 Tax=Colletotrichum tabaci TaxID=1209068 RepID=A0AAV9TSL4_9PEZI